MQEIGAHTLEMLDRQGEQIRRVQDDLDAIDVNQDRMEREMRSIESVGGQLLNYVTPGTVKARNTNAKVDKEDAKERKKRDKLRAKEEKKAAKEKAKADKMLTVQKKNKKGAQSRPSEEDSREARLREHNLPQ